MNALQAAVRRKLMTDAQRQRRSRVQRFPFWQGALAERAGFVLGRALRVRAPRVFRCGTVIARPARSASAPYQNENHQNISAT